MSTPEATTTPPAAEAAPEEAAPGMIAKVKMSLSDYAVKYELDKKYEAVVAYEEEKKAATIETYESLKASTLEKLEATKAAINEKVVEPYVAPAAEYVAETASATDAKVRELGGELVACILAVVGDLLGLRSGGGGGLLREDRLVRVVEVTDGVAP